MSALDWGCTKGETHDFVFERLIWIQTLWFPWKASDPGYRIPAQLGLILFFPGAVLGTVGMILGGIPLYEEFHDPIFKHPSSKSSATHVRGGGIETRLLGCLLRFRPPFLLRGGDSRPCFHTKPALAAPALRWFFAAYPITAGEDVADLFERGYFGVDAKNNLAYIHARHSNAFRG